jgi:hypothetical protein
LFIFICLTGCPQAETETLERACPKNAVKMILFQAITLFSAGGVAMIHGSDSEG